MLPDTSAERPGRPVPLILAIESSSALLGVAVVLGEDVIFQESLVRPRAHSSMLLPMCLNALNAAGVATRDLSAVAVSAGPGSFTGLRIGCATAQGLAKACGNGVILVPTFEALLSQCAGHRLVALVQGRAKAQTVTALYRSENGHPARSGFASRYGFAEAIPIAARGAAEFLAAALDVTKGDPEPAVVYAAGDAADLLAELAAEDGRKRCPGLEVLPVEANARFPSPAAVGLIGSRMWREGLIVSPDEAVPRYYRKSQAEALAASMRPSSAEGGGGEGFGEPT